jgi:hypothetical protein
VTSVGDFFIKLMQGDVEASKIRERLQCFLTFANVASIGTEVRFRELVRTVDGDLVTEKTMRRMKEMSDIESAAAIVSKRTVKLKDLNTGMKKTPDVMLTPFLPSALIDKLPDDEHEDFMKRRYPTFPGSGVNQSQSAKAITSEVAPIVKTLADVDNFNLKIIPTSNAQHRALYASVMPCAVEEASNNFERREQQCLSRNDGIAFAQCLKETNTVKEGLLYSDRWEHGVSISFLRLGDHVETLGIAFRLYEKSCSKRINNFDLVFEAPLLYKGSKKLIAVSKKDNTRAFMFL